MSEDDSIVQSLPRTASRVGRVTGIPTKSAKAIQLELTFGSVLSGSGQVQVGKTEARGLMEKQAAGLHFVHSVDI